MKKNFKASLEHVLVHEGGWADHPRDPGGATMKGITLATYRRHSGQSRSKKDLRNISDGEIDQIYRSGYWDMCQCDKLPSGVDYTVFDGAVNSGPGRSAIWLQAAIGAKHDGGIGPKTLARVNKHDAAVVADQICDNRLKTLQTFNTWDTFGKGWSQTVLPVALHIDPSVCSHNPGIAGPTHFRVNTE